jgi:hypothetical protein
VNGDEAIVARQIGRAPRGMERVEARCAFGYPTVVSVAPVVPRGRGRGAGRTEPFPTRFWLTCPALREEISRLEAEGLVGRLEEEMAADADLRARVAADHGRHAAEGRAAGGPGVPVGGVRDPARLKCLHAHYAFHLARGGAVGAILDARHGPKGCTAEAVRCDAFREAADTAGGKA